MNLKQQLVVKTPTDEFEIWSKKQYDEYIAGCVEYGAGSAYRIVTHFNEDENLLKDSPYQGSAGVWRSAAKPPGITKWYVVKCEQRRFASLIYADSKSTLERVAKDIDVEIDLLEWLDDSAASPGGDGEAIEILKELCWLKSHKDNVGKDSVYEQRQPEAWKRANEFLNRLTLTTK